VWLSDNHQSVYIYNTEILSVYMCVQNQFKMAHSLAGSAILDRLAARYTGAGCWGVACQYYR